MCNRATKPLAAAPLVLLLAAVAANPGDDKPTRPARIVLVGDSTVNDEGGWGPGFRASFGTTVEVINLARNGRSSKSFRNEGLWDPAITAKPDFVLIQFGHNDCPGKGPERETDPSTTYRANMLRYVEEARNAGAVPVLVTSIVRRVFTPERRIQPDTLAPFVEEVRRIAAEKQVALIDLYRLTLQQAEKAGPEGSLEIGRIDPNGKQDNTHLGPKGQQEIGAMAARELARVAPAVRPYLRADGSPLQQLK